MLEFLPPRLLGAVRHLNRNLLLELRIREDKPLSANVAGEYVFLGESGVCSAATALRPTKREVEDALLAASGYSVYAVEEQLRQGFVTTACGERIGVAGTVVMKGGEVLSIRDVTSLCVRIPHEIFGCAEQIYEICLRERLRSLIILAPPGEGKTTLLRDLSRLISLRRAVNILVVDERGELSAGEVGATSDVIRFSDKRSAFSAGIRAMRPDIIVTDELTEADYPAVRLAIQGGVCVLASAHLAKYADVPQKIFSRYVLLDGLGRVGSICGEDGNDLAETSHRGADGRP